MEKLNIIKTVNVLCNSNIFNAFRFSCLFGKILTELATTGKTSYDISGFKIDREAITNPDFEPVFKGTMKIIPAKLWASNSFERNPNTTEYKIILQTLRNIKKTQLIHHMRLIRFQLYDSGCKQCQQQWKYVHLGTRNFPQCKINSIMILNKSH